jgi:redox-sensitive bicupin YhaK (pirin superfamily)
MTTQIFPADQRGRADFGWLQANFSFSFGNYFNPDNVQFGALRVLNDDTIAAGAGFGTHPHDNMEIITIPLEGGLRHRDSMGNEGVIGFSEVQVMSAGTGILHSEMNASQTERAKTLQLWVFPDTENAAPRYDQKSFDIERQMNTFVTVVTPQNKNDGQALWIHQQAFLSLGIFEGGQQTDYKVNLSGNGTYLFLIEGQISIDGKILNQRDAMGISDFDGFQIDVISKAKILLVEVPMNN